VDCARCCRSMFAMYLRANSSILISAFTQSCKVPGVIVRLWPLSWLMGLQGQVNPLASSENHCSKDLFRARRRRLPFEPFLSRLTEQARSVKSGVKWSWAWTQACSLSIQSLPPQDRPCRTNPSFGSRRCQSPCAHALRHVVAFP